MLVPERWQSCADTTCVRCLHGSKVAALNLDRLRKDEEEVAREEKSLERARNLHLREMKRIADEDRSKYQMGSYLPSISGSGENRYMLMSLLGKGGFSEVG